MGAAKKNALVRLALQAVGPHALPASINVLLLHALTAYESEQHAMEESRREVVAAKGEDDRDDGAVFVLLSRNSQKKAKKGIES